MLMRLVRDDVMASQTDPHAPADGSDELMADDQERQQIHAQPQVPDSQEDMAGADTAQAEEQADGPVAEGDGLAIGNGVHGAGDDDPAQAGVDGAILEALLFSTHHPLTAGRLAELMELESTKPLRKAIKALNQQYEQSGRSFRIEQVAGGYQLLTLPEYGDYLARMLKREVDSKLTRAALETLAIIAYKQPILRADIEAIRGVACGETIRSLMEKHLVKISGRAELPGRPILYGTTKRFLETFGLNNLKDLPQNGEAGKAGT
jgi:segregation and condensation protein B